MATLSALRAPAHPLARRLLQLARVPLAAPSANPFSYISPTSATHVQQGLGRRIKHILDGGESAVGVESTVLDLTNPERPVILRPGAIDEKMLGRFLHREVHVRSGTKPKERFKAPGLLERHYSPHTPLSLMRKSVVPTAQRAVILQRKPAGKIPPHTYWLSERGALAGIAHNLYRVLREADAANYREIFIQPVPPTAGGLAAAINDRIRRAAA
ncbi:MAG: Sua5 family C-terminal domain-containing protein [Lacunisphaera sp.]